MPNGGSDCCGTCWFNRSNGGERGSSNFNPSIPSYCEIRGLAISNPFYTYCANHPNHRPGRDPLPIGPAYVHAGFGAELGNGEREFWQPSPDTPEIRQHLLDLVRTREEHGDPYPFTPMPAPFVTAIQQLVEFGDVRVVEALEDLAQKLDSSEAREGVLEMRKTVAEQLGL